MPKTTPHHALDVLGLGLATPHHAVPQATLARSAHDYCAASEAQRRKIDRIYEGTTIQKRGVVLMSNGAGGDTRLSGRTVRQRMAAFYPVTGTEGSGTGGPGVAVRMARYAEEAPKLGRAAAVAALDQAGIEPGRIDQLVAVSCTGFAAPGLDAHLIRSLGLRADVQRTMVGFMGCHGALNGLRVARALSAGDPGQTVLLCCVELCSLHFQYGFAPQQIVANALFADGAAALVGRARGTTPTTQEPRLIDQASVIIPDSADDMTWRIGGHGFVMTLSPRVPALIAEHLRPWLQAWLHRHDLEPAQIDHWVIHPGGPRVITAVEAALELPPGAGDASRAVLSEHGNMSSPTVLFILDRLRRGGATGPCVMLAFGPGLTAEAALLRL